MGVDHFFLISAKQFNGKNISELDVKQTEPIRKTFFPKFRNAYEKISKIRETAAEKWITSDEEVKLDEKEYKYYLFPYFGEVYSGYEYLDHKKVQESLKLFTTQFPEFTFRIWFFPNHGLPCFYEMTDNKATNTTDFSLDQIPIKGMSVYIKPTLDTIFIDGNITGELNSEYKAQKTDI